MACLDPRWAGGRPRLISPDDAAFIVATANTRPEALGQPFTRWSLRKLADYLNLDPGPRRVQTGQGHTQTGQRNRADGQGDRADGSGARRAPLPAQCGRLRLRCSHERASAGRGPAPRPAPAGRGVGRDQKLADEAGVGADVRRLSNSRTSATTRTRWSPTSPANRRPPQRQRCARRCAPVPWRLDEPAAECIADQMSVPTERAAEIPGVVAGRVILFEAADQVGDLVRLETGGGRDERGDLPRRCGHPVARRRRWPSLRRGTTSDRTGASGRSGPSGAAHGSM